MAGIRGPDPATRGPGADEIVELLRAYQRARPASEQPRLAQAGSSPSVGSIYRRFGSWSASLQAAGLV
jgi:hypothetical protein